MGYGQSYYTLRSIFMDRVPPPIIHLHIRSFDVVKSVPIGDISNISPNVVLTNNSTLASNATETEISEDEHRVFDQWLRNLWMEKDDLISNYHKTGSLSTSDPISIPVKLRKTRDFLDAFCFFSPVVMLLTLNWCVGR